MNTLTLPKKEDKSRKTRVRVSGNRDVLTVYGKEPGFIYRWVLDIGSRLEKFLKAGYETVTHPVEVGDARAAVPAQIGSGTYALSGNGTNKLVLMRIKEEYYKEDQDAKEAEIMAIEASMGKDVEGSYGKVEIERK